MRARTLTVLAGVGALAALAVMIVAVAKGPEGGRPSPRAAVFAEGSLTVGLDDDQLTSVSPDLVAQRIDRLASSGTRFTRVSLRWVEVAASRPAAPTNPDDPAYAWGLYDAVLDGLHARGIEAILVVSGAPAWSNGDKGPEVAPGLDDYAAFMTALATRYDGRLHPRVRLFEPWEEPNSPLFLTPQWDAGASPPVPASPRIYAQMVRRASAAVKAVQPDAEIVGLGTADIETSLPPTGGVSVLDFVRALAADHPPMDAASVHLQPSVLPNVATDAVPSFATMPRLIAEIDKVAPGVPIYVTQFGYATDAGGVSEADQATAITQSLQRLAALGRVRLALWLGLQDSPLRPSGLLRADGTEKPSWAAFTGSPKVLPAARP